jgi:hypothetical protein
MKMILWVIPSLLTCSSLSAHDVYSNLRDNNTGVSCCNGQDCHQVTYENVKNGAIFHFGGHDIFVEEWRIQRKILDKKEPDVGHWCGTIDENYGPYTFCAYAPPPYT